MGDKIVPNIQNLQLITFDYIYLKIQEEVYFFPDVDIYNTSTFTSKITNGGKIVDTT
jgi:hypothetical protein